MKKNNKLKKVISPILVLALILAQFQMIIPSKVSAATPVFAYITNCGAGYGNSVSVVDVNTNTVVNTIYGFNAPWAVVLNPAKAEAYVSNLNGNSISVIDTETNTKVRDIPSGWPYPKAMEISPDGTKLYVITQNRINIIDTITYNVTPVNLSFSPETIALAPDGTKIYMVLSNTVRLFDTVTNTETGISIPVGTQPSGIAITPNGEKVYVGDVVSQKVYVIPTGTNTISGTVNFSGAAPLNITITPDGTKAYISRSGNLVSVMDTSSGVLTNTITVGSNPDGISVTPDGSRVFVANSGSNNVSVINTGTDQVVNTISVGTDPRAYGKFIGVLRDSPPRWPAGSVNISNLTPNSATVSWPAATDGEGVVSYNIYQNTNLVATVAGTTYDLNGLTPNTSYPIKVEAMDANGNWSSNGPGGTVTTSSVDVTPPIVSGTSPPNGAVGLPLNPTITIDFPEPVTLDPNASVYLKAGSTVVDCTYTIDGPLYIFPAANLLNATDYTVTLPAGAVRDLSGNPLASDYTFRFSTLVSPEIVSTFPSADSFGVIPAVGIDINFAKNIFPDINFGAISLKKGDGTVVNYTYFTNTNNLHLTPASGLQGNTTYTVSIPAGAITYQDYTTNSAYNFSFTTGNEVVSPSTPIAGGDASGYTLRPGGTVWGWGWNAWGQLGNGSNADSVVPVQVAGMTGAISVAGGDSFEYALKSDGTVWAWGINSYGELGTASGSSVPVQLTGLSNVVAIAGGHSSGYALKSDGTVWAWGLNYYGQLGNGSTTNSSVPLQVAGLTGVISIAAGDFAAYALKYDGTVWAWGQNAYGQLGNGSTSNSSVPVQVSGLTNITDVDGGYNFGYAVKSDGTVWSWGRNDCGQLGNGSTIDSHVPLQISGLTGVKAVARTWFSSYALKSDGTVWAWGWNPNGELGNNSTSNSLVPVQVSGLSNVAAISGGYHSGYALKFDGTAWAWGWNGYGQLGNGSTTNSLVPVQVSWPASNIISTAPDTTPPSWSGVNLILSNATQTGVTLSWTADAYDPDDSVSYFVYNGTALLGTTTSKSFDVNGLTPNTTYTLNVKAVDSHGNWSSDLPIIFSTSLPFWTTPNFQVNGITSTSLTLSWAPAYAPPASNIVAYNVYQDGIYRATVNSTAYNIIGLSPSTTHSFRIEAMNCYGLWSNSGPTISATTLPLADTTPPTIVTTSPINGNTNVHSYDTISIKFTESIRPGSALTGISLTANSGTTTVNCVYNITGDTLTLVPSTGLQPATAYTVRIPAGAVTDYVYNSLASSYTFGFTTSILGDLNLEKTVRTALNKPTGSITATDMAGLTVLNAVYSNVSDLSGLQYASNLKRLYLGNNLIADLSPLVNLKGLEELWLNNNQISDTTISNVYGLTNLKWLYLNSNYISNIQPLSNLRNLQVLYLNNNNITNVSPLSSLVSLRGLGLGYNNVTSISALNNLVNLEMLDLQAQSVMYTYPQLTDVSAVAYMPYLRKLLLNNNNIADLAPLKGLTNLKELTLWNNGIADDAFAGITPLSGLTSLTDLWLGYNYISNLTPLAGLTNLKVLDLKNNSVCDTVYNGIAPLSQLYNLQWVFLGGNYFTDLTPLISNSNNGGLGYGDHVYLPPSITTDIQPLIDKSVEVVLGTPLLL